MKLAIKIFTTYLLALSLVPCGDGGGGILEIANHLLGTEHQHISDHDQHSNGCGDDSCSPFCVCSCCSISVNTPTSIGFKLKQRTPFPLVAPAFTNTHLPYFFNPSIWQPPTFS